MSRYGGNFIWYLLDMFKGVKKRFIVLEMSKIEKKGAK